MRSAAECYTPVWHQVSECGVTVRRGAGRGFCDHCGERKGKLFAYGISEDGRVTELQGAFCCVSCFESRYGRIV